MRSKQNKHRGSTHKVHERKAPFDVPWPSSTALPSSLASEYSKESIGSLKVKQQIERAH